MSKPTFQQIATFQYSSEAVILKGKLESEGIDVFMKDNIIVDANPGYSNAYGGIKVFVRNEDFEQAKEICSEINDNTYNDNLKLIKCPNCRSQEIELTTAVKEGKSFISKFFSAILAAFSPKTTHKYTCTNCKHEFDTI